MFVDERPVNNQEVSARLQGEYANTGSADHVP